MANALSDPRPANGDPTGLRALVSVLESEIAKVRAGDRTAYGPAREAARDIETRARRIDVDLSEESYAQGGV